MTQFPTPHLEKLSATLENEKLPARDKPRVQAAIDRYQQWIRDLNGVAGSSPVERLRNMIALLNEYRTYIDVELIFDSQDDFLYRQKGQLKLDNSVIEEFLPRLIQPEIIPEVEGHSISVGPTSSFASVFFSSDLATPLPGGGLSIRTKDQDFAISRKIHIKASHWPDFQDPIQKDTFITYVAAECKTNLDKTMFQEACATAHDVKSAVAGAKYFLLCEWLDMTPLSTAATDIDEVIILRKAKRINSNVRSKFSTFAGRKANRAQYSQYLAEHPFANEMFERFIDHVRLLLKNDAPAERDVLDHGYF